MGQRRWPGDQGGAGPCRSADGTGSNCEAMKLPARPTLVHPFPHTSLGAAPGTLTVHPNAFPPKIDFHGSSDGECEALIVTDVETLPALVAKYQRCWINVDGLGD